MYSSWELVETEPDRDNYTQDYCPMKSVQDIKRFLEWLPFWFLVNFDISVEPRFVSPKCTPGSKR